MKRWSLVVESTSPEPGGNPRGSQGHGFAIVRYGWRSNEVAVEGDLSHFRQRWDRGQTCR